MQEKSVITSTVETPAGVFAPWHLGELTQIVDFALVDAVLEETGRREKRLRLLPSRMVVYFVLALALFERHSYRMVWSKLTSGLDPAGSGASLGLLADTGQAQGGGRAPAGSVRDACRARRPPRAGRVLLPGPAHGGCRRDPAAHSRRRDAHLALPQAGRGESGVRLSAAAAAGTGRVRHPSAHHRRLRTGVRGRNSPMPRGFCLPWTRRCSCWPTRPSTATSSFMPSIKAGRDSSCVPGPAVSPPPPSTWATVPPSPVSATASSGYCCRSA